MIDHLVLATDDLERSVARIGAEWGVTPTPGGAHVGRGTRNELVAIGNGAYLEIVGPDLDQADHVGERPFGVGVGSGERLTAWCARPISTIDHAADAAQQHGHDVGPVAAMSRRRPDGALLEWRLSFPPPTVSALPFIIDWLQSEHPTATLHQPVQLLELQLCNADPTTTRSVIEAIGGDPRIIVVDAAAGGGQPVLLARLHTPAGDVTLSSD